MSYRPGSICLKYLRYVSGPGEPADDRDMTISGAVTPAVYEYAVPADFVLHWRRMNFHVRAGTIRYDRFGDAELTNGILIKVLDEDGVELLDVCDGESHLTVASMSELAGVDAAASRANAAGDDFQPVRWTVGTEKAWPLLFPGDRIQLTLQDDLSSLTVFRVMVQGIFENYNPQQLDWRNF